MPTFLHTYQPETVTHNNNIATLFIVYLPAIDIVPSAHTRLDQKCVFFSNIHMEIVH